MARTSPSGGKGLVLFSFAALYLRDFIRQSAGDAGDGLDDKVVMLGQPGVEAAEGAFAGDVVLETAQVPEFLVRPEAVEELDVVANVEDAFDKAGPEHCPDGVSWAAGMPVSLESVGKRLVIQVLEDLFQEADAVFRRL